MGGNSLTDHFITFENLMYSVISFYLLEQIENLIDHLTIQLNLVNHTNTMIAKSNCIDRINFYLPIIELAKTIFWSKMTFLLDVQSMWI